MDGSRGFEYILAMVIAGRVQVEAMRCGGSTAMFDSLAVQDEIATQSAEMQSEFYRRSCTALEEPRNRVSNLRNGRTKRCSYPLDGFDKVEAVRRVLVRHGPHMLPTKQKTAV